MEREELYTMLEPDFEFSDDRGKLSQLAHDGYKQINILRTKKGVLRGGHFHRCSVEAFYVVKGSVEVTLKRYGKNEEKDMVSFGCGAFFKIKPYVVHSMYFPEDCILLAMYDKSVELPDGTKDILVEEI